MGFFHPRNLCQKEVSRLWEECSQEEAWIEAKEEKMGSEDKYLIVHSKKGRIKPHHFKGKNSHHRDNIRKNMSRSRCYTCDEVGNFAKDCPKNKIHSHKKKVNRIRHHAHAVEDDEPSKKRSRYESEYSSSKDECVLIFALTGNITHSSDDWLIDSGASKHMTRFKESFVRLSEH